MLVIKLAYSLSICFLKTEIYCLLVLKQLFFNWLWVFILLGKARSSGFFWSIESDTQSPGTVSAYIDSFAIGDFFLCWKEGPSCVEMPLFVGCPAPIPLSTFFWNSSCCRRRGPACRQLSQESAGQTTLSRPWACPRVKFRSTVQTTPYPPRTWFA